MERVVAVKRCRRTGAFVLNPMGTFRGFGGFVGLARYREVPVGSPPAHLGDSIVSLLALSGPTGVPIGSAADYLTDSADDETRRVRAAYGLDGRRLTAATLARRFDRAEVSFRDGLRSWLVRVFRYDPGRRTDSAAGQPSRRLPLKAGAGALGAAVIELLDPGAG